MRPPPLHKECLRLLEQGQPPVLAEVVRCSGSTPQKPGAKLLVRRDGTIAGTLGGGCVEADVWAEAMALMQQGGSPSLKAFPLNEELETQDGLVCGGTMYIFLDPLREADRPIWQKVVRAAQGEPAVALLTLLTGDRVGTKMLVAEDGSVTGSLGDEAMEAELRSQALSFIAARSPSHRYLKQGETAFMAEVFAAPPAIAILGAGHIGRALSALATQLSFRTLVIDDRAEFASRDRFPDAEQVLVTPYDSGLSALTLTANDAIVVATRGHKFDQVALESACRTTAGYLGLVGSRRKAHLIFPALEAAGIAPERIKQIRCPAGLNIGSRTPEEIAVSILSEILMLRRGGDGRPMKIEPLVHTGPT